MRGGRPLSVLLAAASMAVGGMGVQVINVGKSDRFDDEPIPPRRRSLLNLPKVSYSGGRHKGAREIARRQRQRLQVNENRLARAEPEATRNGFGRSRRGRLVDCFVALPA